MQAVILVGGLGTRLRPLTYKIPKVMVAVKGKPFLEYQLELLKKNKIKNVLLCAGYLAEDIKKYFSRGEKMGLKIIYSIEKKSLGTGGALKNAENLLESQFLLLNGDTFLDIDYVDLFSYFGKSKRTGALAVFKNKPKIIKNNILADSNNEIANYNKKKEGLANFVDAGVQAFDKKIIDLIPPGKAVSLEEEIWPVLIEKKELIVYPVSQRFYDIGTFKRLKIFESIIDNI